MVAPSPLHKCKEWLKEYIIALCEGWEPDFYLIFKATLNHELCTELSSQNQMFVVYLWLLYLIFMQNS